MRQTSGTISLEKWLSDIRQALDGIDEVKVWMKRVNDKIQSLEARIERLERRR